MTCALFASKCVHACRSTSGLASLTLASRSLPSLLLGALALWASPVLEAELAALACLPAGRTGERSGHSCAAARMSLPAVGREARQKETCLEPSLSCPTGHRACLLLLLQCPSTPCADHHSGPPAPEPANRAPTHLEHCWPSLSFTAWQRGSPLSVVGCTMARGCWEACRQAVGRAVGHSVAGN